MRRLSHNIIFSIRWANSKIALFVLCVCAGLNVDTLMYVVGIIVKSGSGVMRVDYGFGTSTFSYRYC